MIYLDNAATSFPKPPAVARAAAGVIAGLGGNPGRGGHRGALAGARVTAACREAIARLLGADEPERVIFTLNCTDALNIALRGTLHEGDHVLCSHDAHNAVMRVLAGYEAAGKIEVTVLKPDAAGVLSPGELLSRVTPRTGLCVLSHASNVTGVLQPIPALYRACRRVGVPLLLDAAQSAGCTAVRADWADMIAMPGHKGLLGPMGTGVLYVGRGMLPRPLREGGTGSQSDSMRQPVMLPDRYESGTVNLPGIAGLLKGVQFVARHGAAIEEYERALTFRLRAGLLDIPRVTVYGALDTPAVAVTSFNIEGRESAEIADALSDAGIAVRGGLHCAPAMHRFLGTQGTVRASLGPYNTEDDVDDLLAMVQRLAR